MNLAHIREMSTFTHSYYLFVTVIWENGDRDVFEGEQAVALIDAWEKAYAQQRDPDEGDRSGE